MIHVQESQAVHFAIEDKESHCPRCKATGFGNPCTAPAKDRVRAAAGYRDALPTNTVHIERVRALGLF